MERISRLLVITKYELVKVLRQPITLFFTFFFPIGWIFFCGEFYGNFPSPLFDGVGNLDFMIPAIIFLIILVNGLSSLPLIISNNINSKVLKRYSITRLTKTEYISAIFLSNLVLVYFASFVSILFAYIRYHILITSNIFIFILTVAIIASGIASFGMLIASRIKGFQSVVSASFLIYFTTLFISGAAVPLPILPPIIRTIANYIPFTYMVYLLRDIWIHGNFVDIKNTVISILTSVLLIAIIFKFFKWEHK